MFTSWQKKYCKAIKNHRQLIGDSKMREVILDMLSDFQVLNEVRFKGFTADMLAIDTKRKITLGAEVKSDRDTLEKLEHQLLGYSRYCNYVCVFATLSQKREIEPILRQAQFSHVGLYYYFLSDDGRDFICKRPPIYRNLGDIGTRWISKRHQLYQWLYILEEIWGQ